MMSENHISSCLHLPYWSRVEPIESQCRMAVRTVGLHYCKGDTASQWEMAILGCQNSVTPEPIDKKNWFFDPAISRKLLPHKY